MSSDEGIMLAEMVRHKNIPRFDSDPIRCRCGREFEPDEWDHFDAHRLVVALSVDPLRLALREPSDELIARAEAAIRAQTYDIRGNAWPTFIRAVLAALAEAVTPDA